MSPDIDTTQSDIAVLRDKGFTLEKMCGEGSYAKVNINILNI